MPATWLTRCDSTNKVSTETIAGAVCTSIPLFEAFGDLHREIGTRVPMAQRYFDQGPGLAYGFNHEAAGGAFADAARPWFRVRDGRDLAHSWARTRLWLLQTFDNITGCSLLHAA